MKELTSNFYKSYTIFASSSTRYCIAHIDRPLILFILHIYLGYWKIKIPLLFQPFSFHVFVWYFLRIKIKKKLLVPYRPASHIVYVTCAQLPSISRHLSLTCNVQQQGHSCLLLFPELSELHLLDVTTVLESLVLHDLAMLCTSSDRHDEVLLMTGKGTSMVIDRYIFIICTITDKRFVTVELQC